ncbi:MAG TPA: hypothetical protein DCY88_26460 [Cyanobacteria bacterium UBA11372]|nr:hypothetical protein [Cyanobacteria bacterium UBA11372]
MRYSVIAQGKCSGTLKGARTLLSFGVPHTTAIRYIFITYDPPLPPMPWGESSSPPIPPLPRGKAHRPPCPPGQGEKLTAPQGIGGWGGSILPIPYQTRFATNDPTVYRAGA